MPRKHQRETGGITLMVLVMLVVFGLIMSAALQYVGRQSHDISRRKAITETRYAAEVGVERALWLLAPAPAGGGKTADDVSPVNPLPQQNASSTIMNRFFASSGLLNFFEFTDHDATAGKLALRSVGVNPNLSDTCRIVEADIRALKSGTYSVTNWLEQERDCTADGFGCTFTVGSGETQPSCPQMERGCAAYPILTRPSENHFTRTVTSALTSDDCATFESLPGKPLDAYWIGIKPNAILRFNYTATGFTPIVQIWEPNGISDCQTLGGPPPYKYNCKVRPNEVNDHYIVVVYATNASQVGEYTLTIKYEK